MCTEQTFPSFNYAAEAEKKGLCKHNCPMSAIDLFEHDTRTYGPEKMQCALTTPHEFWRNGE